MNHTSFYDCLKCSIESMKDNSLLPLLENDSDYQRYSECESLAEAQYSRLDLSKEQKEVINNLLDARDNESSEYSNLSYLAGIIDCIKFMKYLNVPIEKIVEESHIK